MTISMLVNEPTSLHALLKREAFWLVRTGHEIMSWASQGRTLAARNVAWRRVRPDRPVSPIGSVPARRNSGAKLATKAGFRRLPMNLQWFPPSRLRDPGDVRSWRLAQPGRRMRCRKAIPQVLSRGILRSGLGAAKERNADSGKSIDVHGCAEALLCNARMSQVDEGARQLLIRTASWTLDHMQAKDGYFIYRIIRRGRKETMIDVPFIRWGQAWMICGLAAALEVLGTKKPTRVSSHPVLHQTRIAPQSEATECALMSVLVCRSASGALGHIVIATAFAIASRSDAVSVWFVRDSQVVDTFAVH